MIKVYLKAKKMTDISQTQAGCKAKSLGILCGFQGQYRIILSADTASEVRQMPCRSCRSGA